eukprot:gene21276-23347_t
MFRVPSQDGKPPNKDAEKVKARKQVYQSVSTFVAFVALLRIVGPTTEVSNQPFSDFGKFFAIPEMPCSATQKLFSALEEHLAREVKFAPSLSHYCAADEDYATPRQRDQSLHHLLRLSLHFGFEPETFALAVNYTDRFLGRVKVHVKYLECISLASLYLAAKMSEEEEFVPTASDFVAVSRTSCKATDILRMECLMVQKLGWDLFVPSAVLFIQKFCDVLQALGYLSTEFASTVVQHILPKLLKLLCQHSFVQHKGSTLALSVLQYEIAPLGPSLSNAMGDIIKILKIDYGDIMHCHGLIQDFMDLQATFSHKSMHHRKRRKSSRSNSFHIMPTIYESLNSPDFEMVDNNNDVFEDCPSEDKENYCPEEIDHNHNDKKVWLDNKQEFPDIFDTLPTPRRTAHKNAKQLYNCSIISSLSRPDRPLYSTIVKTTYSSIAYLYAGNDHTYTFCHGTEAF